MRILIILPVLFMGFNALGQSGFDLSVESRGGYEYNVFNANENRTINRGDEVVLALQSGYFQHFNVSSGLKLEGKYHKLQLDASLKYDYFPELREATLMRPKIGLKYTFKFNKAHSLAFGGNYNMYNTNRPADDTEVLLAPRSYKRLKYNAKYTLKLFKGNQLYVKAERIQNDYRTAENRIFIYKANELTASLSQRLFNSKKQSHSIGVKFRHAVRFYEDVTFFEDSEEEIEREREWQYFVLTGEYSWRMKKKFKLTLGFIGTERRDIIQDRFGYRNYQPYLKFSIKRKRVELSLKTSVARRDYFTLKANTSTDELLRHEYLRAALNLNLRLSKKLLLSIKGSGIRRIRNFPEGATSFLAYDNAVVSIGLKYDLF